MPIASKAKPTKAAAKPAVVTKAVMKPAVKGKWPIAAPAKKGAAKK
jgi:hypothetical protein